MAIARYPLATVFRGTPTVAGPVVHRCARDGSELQIVPAGWSRADFEWGIDSEGASCLAYAILHDAFGVDEADSFALDFKYDVVIDLPEEWRLTVSDLADWISGYQDV